MDCLHVNRFLACICYVKFLISETVCDSCLYHVPVGKYHPGVDKPDPKTWKANFRCAMNSLPDIEEVKDKSMKSGSNAFRMYRILSSTERAAKKGTAYSLILKYLADACIQNLLSLMRSEQNSCIILLQLLFL